MPFLLKFALYALLPMGVVMFLPPLLFGLQPSRTSEVVGYSAMALSLTATFFAMREAQGLQPTSSFSGLLGVGVAVSAIAALGFGLLTWALMVHMGEAGVEALMRYYIDQVLAAGGPDQAARLAELEAYRPMLRNSPLQGLVMGATVFLIGVLESLLGALWLRRAKTRSL